MPNRNYIKGKVKEQKLVRNLREQGHVAFRSAGSHSPIDICDVDVEHKVIHLIQCKPDSMSKAARTRLLSSLSSINGTYVVDVSIT